MKRKANERTKPLPWQTQPEQVLTDTVQYWKHGTMITAQISRAMASRLVSDGKAFVISSQAIGALDDEGNYDS